MGKYEDVVGIAIDMIKEDVNRQYKDMGYNHEPEDEYMLIDEFVKGIRVSLAYDNDMVLTIACTYDNDDVHCWCRVSLNPDDSPISMLKEMVLEFDRYSRVFSKRLYN